MKKTLLIGSTCVDVIMTVQKMPQTGADMNISNQELKLGGCTYNVSDILRHMEIPNILCSPVGTGIYGEYIQKELEKRSIPVFAHITDSANGCCYCVVDSQGERTFLCQHGAEYLFKREFFDSIDMSQVDSAFICGLELEEETAAAEIDYIQELKDFHKNHGTDFTLFFAPGPRVLEIDPVLIERIFSMNPVLHMNKGEALSFTKKSFVLDAVTSLNQATENSVIVTMGEQGCVYYDALNQKSGTAEGVPAKVVDTIGAGDSHMGAVISCLKKGLSLEAAVKNANKVSSAVVSVKGAQLDSEQFKKIPLEF